MGSDSDSAPDTDAAEAADGDDTDDSDDAAPYASHLTPEEKRGPRTIHVALLLLAVLLVVAVASNPAAVLPRDSTLHGERHTDTESGLQITVPVGWEVHDRADFGSIRIAPVGSGTDPETRILAGRLVPGNAAAAIADDEGAATALAEIIQLYVMGIDGTRDDRRTADIDNEVGTGKSVSYVVVPEPSAAAGSGGLVYAAVFGNDDDRWWLAYLTSNQGSAPAPDWVDGIVDDVRLDE